MTKPHRFLLDRVSSYADEATSFVRRRRLDREPFARIHYRGGAIVELEQGGPAASAVGFAAAALLERTRDE